MIVTEDEIIQEWERPNLNGFAIKKIFQILKTLGVLITFGAVLGVIFSLRTVHVPSIIYYASIGAAGGGIISCLFLVPHTVREIYLAANGVPVRGYLHKKTLETVKGKLSLIVTYTIIYTAGGKRYQHVKKVNETLFLAQAVQGNRTILLVDPYKPKRAALVFEVFRFTAGFGSFFTGATRK